ncbi:uncharacterized protein LOC143296377 [Babylonia areolata]|uniref:uncharacterized protein LOC143296377 n=1 Tax=Babylonia areolata TaxID=304850 RepID=UPI003FD116FB
MKPKKENSDLPQCFVLWKLTAQDNFNALCVDTILSPSGSSLILGGVDGIIRVFDVEGLQSSSKPKTSIDTKGGPIQCMTTHNVTHVGQVDILTADAHGTLTVVCGQQILSRQHLTSHAITGLLVQEDGRGYIEIVTSSEQGLINACQACRHLWTINLNDFVKVSRRTFVRARCVLSVEMANSQGLNLQYLLAADDTQHLHIILHGNVVTSLPTPAVVTAMAEGVFVPPSQLDMAGGSLPPGGSSKQVALGTATGAIYIFYNMAITAEEFARAESPITHLAALSQADSPLDLLLCAGHLKALSVYHQGKLACRHPTSDWVNAMVTADVDMDGTKEVVIGCMDKTVTALRVLST